MSICYGDKSRESTPPVEAAPSPSHRFAHLNICKYTGIAHLKEVIESQSQKIQDGLSEEQYLGFQPVAEDEMKTIDSLHASIGKSIRFTYYHDTGLLITKLMPTPALETSHAGFGLLVFLRTMMGIPEGELWPMGAATYYADNQLSFKEGDTSFKPCSRPKATDWPSIVIESGFSESLQGLRSDAKWWLTSSNDGVKIVILIALEMATKSIQMEKWLLAPAANGNGPVTAMKAQEVVILPTSSVTGAPLTLEFENIHLRPPTGQEKDIVLTAGELSKWADGFWGIVQ